MKYVTKSIFNFKDKSVEKTQQNKFILTQSVIIKLVMFFFILTLEIFKLDFELHRIFNSNKYYLFIIY